MNISLWCSPESHLAQEDAESLFAIRRNISTHSHLLELSKGKLKLKFYFPTITVIPRFTPERS